MKSLLGDLNKDGKMSGYEQARQDAIEKNMREQKAVGGLLVDDRINYQEGEMVKSTNMLIDELNNILETGSEEDLQGAGNLRKDLVSRVDVSPEQKLKIQMIERRFLERNLPLEKLRKPNNEGGEMEMLPDEIMEQNFIDFVVGEALSEKEESMLNEQLEANPELSVIFDKVVEKASEFTGAGPVDGPGTGTSDDIPARLSDGEFVFTAKAVEQIGADNLMKMMKEAEAAYDAGGEREGYANGEEVTLEEDDKKVTVEYVQGQQQVTPSQSLLGSMPLYEEDESSKINKESMRLNPTRHVYS